MRTHGTTTSTSDDGFRRVEVITGVGRRRRWTDEEKAWIVAESLEPASSSRRWRGATGCTRASCSSGANSSRPQRSVTRRGSCRCWWRRTAPAPAEPGGPDRDRARAGGGAGRGGRGRGGAAPGARGGAGPGVIAVPPGVRILLAAEPVDFRKGMDGLAALVQQALRADPFAGEVFIFRPRRGDRIKILVYDGTGLVLYAKRLEAGRFCWPSPAEGVVRLTGAQLATLLEGLPWHRLQPRPVRRPSTAC